MSIDELKAATFFYKSGFFVRNVQLYCGTEKAFETDVLAIKYDSAGIPSILVVECKDKEGATLRNMVSNDFLKKYFNAGVTIYLRNSPFDLSKHEFALRNGYIISSFQDLGVGTDILEHISNMNASM